MEPLLLVLALLTLTGCGLIAGTFFAFSSFVMAALGRRPDTAGLAAMQEINIAVINPVFMTVFLGTAAASVALAVVALLQVGGVVAAFHVAGAALYLVGTVLVTLACNVPLNDRLARQTPGTPEATAVWRGYLHTWTRWNHVRTAAATASMVSVAIALYLTG